MLVWKRINQLKTNSTARKRHAGLLYANGQLRMGEGDTASYDGCTPKPLPSGREHRE